MSAKNTKVYPVEIELSENFLEKNPTIKSLYKDGKYNVKLSQNIEEDFAGSITSIMEDLKGRELAIFNPLVDAINQMADLDNIKEVPFPEYDPDLTEKENEAMVKVWEKNAKEQYKQVNGMIRSFNGSLAKSKKEIKQPSIDFNKKIDNLFNFLKDFSDARREVADVNFKNLLEKERLEKEEKERKQKEAELQEIRDLELKNQEQNEKLVAAEAKASYAATMESVMNFFSYYEQQIPQLNAAGLDSIKAKAEEHKFDFSAFGPMEQANLESLKKGLLNGLILLIENQREQINGPAVPELEPTAAPQQDIIDSFEVKGPDLKANDSSRFENIIYRLDIAKVHVENMDLEFQSPEIAGLKEKLQKQFEGLVNNIDVLKAFVEKKQNQFNSLNQ